MSEPSVTKFVRGGAPVGRLADLRHVELAAVQFLRAWCEGRHYQARVRGEAIALLGRRDGVDWSLRFGELLSLAIHRSRRPLVRHAFGCPRLGSDEALFATLVSVAAEADREEAAMLAALVVRADAAPVLAGLAETVGLGIKRMGLRSRAQDRPDIQAADLTTSGIDRTPRARRSAPHRTLH